MSACPCYLEAMSVTVAPRATVGSQWWCCIGMPWIIRARAPFANYFPQDSLVSIRILAHKQKDEGSDHIGNLMYYQPIIFLPRYHSCFWGCGIADISAVCSYLWTFVMTMVLFETKCLDGWYFRAMWSIHVLFFDLYRFWCNFGHLSGLYKRGYLLGSSSTVDRKSSISVMRFRNERISRGHKRHSVLSLTFA
jgi:hypothetical protein